MNNNLEVSRGRPDEVLPSRSPWVAFVAIVCPDIWCGIHLGMYEVCQIWACLSCMQITSLCSLSCLKQMATSMNIGRYRRGG